MKIALATFGSRGDVQPFLALGRALQAEGHEPVVCAPPDFDAFVTGQGLPFRPVGRECQQALIDAGGTLKGMIAATEAIVERQFEELPSAVEGCQLLLATGALLSGHFVAGRLGIPYRFVAFCPTLLRSRHHASPAIPWHEAPAWLNAATWWFNDRFWSYVLRGFLRRSGKHLRWEGSLFDTIVGTRPLLAADAALAPRPPDRPDVVQTGAWFLPDDEPLPPEVEAFLAAGEPPVYIGFGSMVDSRPERTTRQVIEAVEAAGVRALISSGWAGLGASGLPASIQVIGPVSHAKLFPRVRAVVHHGGAGTTHAVARAGVPQVIVPHLLDQFYWGHRMRTLGLAPGTFRRDRLSAPRLAAALRACVEDPALHQRARELAARLVLDGPGRAIAALRAEGLLEKRAAA